MTKTLMISLDENNEIATFGEDFAGGIVVASYPSDFWKYNVAKYRWNGSAIVKRESWIADPDDAEWSPATTDLPSRIVGQLNNS